MIGRDDLARRIAALVDDSEADAFEALALEIHHWQRIHAPVVEALTEGVVERWPQIPAVPVDLFKQLPVGTVREEDDAVCFLTSGTTSGARGAHRIRDTGLYDRGALSWFRACVPHAPDRVVALLLDPSDHPESSLSHMVELFGEASWHLSEDGLDVDGLNAALRTTEPTFVAATAFALHDWLESEPSPLPAGSVLMVTGGFKGRTHALDHDALYARAQQVLEPERLVTEYGMTELSSQLWGTPSTPYRPPHWMKVMAVDPERGTPVERGQLRFFDLCNLDSTVGVETLDEGIVHGDGSVTLLGRLPGAPSRGCSLSVEEAWGR